jgi:biofilm PGA synthesis N-glycosyltransferase PgaC
MPETFKGLWKQRLRWAQGGVEVMQQHARNLLSWRKRRMWGVLAEYFTSVIWAYVMLGILILWALGLVFEMPPALYVDTVLPRWHGMVLALICMAQFAISMVIDRRYEQGVGRNYFWMVWYPIAYWLLSLFTTVWAVPKTLARGKRKRATWVSPDRGVGT